MYLSRTTLVFLLLVSWIGLGYLYLENRNLEAKIRRIANSNETAEVKNSVSFGDLATGSISALAEQASRFAGQGVEWHGRYVTVQDGDTLMGLANRHNQKVKVLVRLNKLKAPYVLYPGQRLLMP